MQKLKLTEIHYVYYQINIFGLVPLLFTDFAFAEMKVLLLDGQNNHNWKATTPVIVKALERDNFCKVTVFTSPSKKFSQDA